MDGKNDSESSKENLEVKKYKERISEENLKSYKIIIEELITKDPKMGPGKIIEEFKEKYNEPGMTYYLINKLAGEKNYQWSQKLDSWKKTVVDESKREKDQQEQKNTDHEEQSDSPKSVEDDGEVQKPEQDFTDESTNMADKILGHMYKYHSQIRSEIRQIKKHSQSPTDRMEETLKITANLTKKYTLYIKPAVLEKLTPLIREKYFRSSDNKVSKRKIKVSEIVNLALTMALLLLESEKNIPE